MKKLFLLLCFLLSVCVLYPQNFFREDFEKDKSYIILMNPTVGNIEVVNFLLEKKLLDVDLDQVNFVGVYHINQEYDFSRTAQYIEENKLKAYYLHEVREELPEVSLFNANACTEEFQTIFENSIGVFFFGGPDIPPSVYGEENLYSETNDPVRHFFESSFIFHLLGGRQNLSFVPLLNENPCYLVTGFCLGMQTMNVATGGSLYQDIPAQIYGSYSAETTLKTDRKNLHRNYWQNIIQDQMLMGTNIHPVQFTGDAFFGLTVKIPRHIRPLVFSSHHQAVKEVGEGFEVAALSNDGKVIEAMIHKKYSNVFAVQFHPEVPALYKNGTKVKFNPDDKPETLHRMLDRKSLAFHRNYWSHISEVIKDNAVKESL